MFARALVVLLLCMNLGVGLWWATHREAAPPLPVGPVSGTGSLTLLGEVEPATLDPSAELAAEPVELAPGVVCLSLGPFTTPAEMRVAMNALIAHVERIQFREVAAVELRGYRVYLPAAGSRAQALETARALSSRGITDYYVVTAGDQQNTVSLGIFRELANAEKRRAEIAALGYTPTVDARTERMPQWWIDLAAEPGFDWRALVADEQIQAASKPCS